ncbi:MAG TPA: hypothetical protein VK945_12370, partial [Planococcus sp. (in: firmicutes)]|nr:hypothetical protein [Planococcus sp. (in: firmicutes)]
MAVLFFNTITELDFAFTAIDEGFAWLYITGIIVLGLSLFAWFGQIFFAQTVIGLGFLAVVETVGNPLFILLIVLQIALAAWTLYRFASEIELTANRHMEKTHLLPRNVTKGGGDGIRDWR